jgi:hypothetical protein
MDTPKVITDDSRTAPIVTPTPTAGASDAPVCELCGEPMPAGEEMFVYHGYSGPCPTPPQAAVPAPTPMSSRWQELFWALPPGPMRSKLRSLEIDVSRTGAGGDCAGSGDGNQPIQQVIDEMRREAVKVSIAYGPGPFAEELAAWADRIAAALRSLASRDRHTTEEETRVDSSSFANSPLGNDRGDGRR